MSYQAFIYAELFITVFLHVSLSLSIGFFLIKRKFYPKWQKLL